MKYKIDNNIPIPSDTYKCDFENMKVGNSSFVPVLNGRSCSVIRSSIEYQASKYRKKNNKSLRDFKTLTRTVEEKGVKGVRVWRIQ